ncbi:MAG: AI-2E family transporter [Rubrobacter sp.]|nr:AI-2E family transporter [Rubrobacter sp.]
MEDYRTLSRIVYGGIYRGIGLVFALLLGVYFVYEIRTIVLVLLLTLLFAIVLSGPVNYLARRGLPKVLGVLAVLGGFVVALWLASIAIIPVIQEQAQQFIRDFPALLDEVQDLAASVGGTDLRSLLQEGEDSLSSNFTLSSALDVGRSITEGISLGLVSFIVTVYLVLHPTMLVDGFVSLFPAGRRERVRDVLGKMYRAVQKWFLGQLSAMLIIGVLTTIALYIIGIPYALFIGALSGILAFIPLVGTLISLIPQVILALALHPILVVWVVLSSFIIHQVEAHVIHPVVMSRAVTLHPVVVISAILVMGTLFNVMGLLLAVPLVAALSVLVRELWISRMNQMGTDPHAPTPEQEKTTPEKIGPMRRALNKVWRSEES